MVPSETRRAESTDKNAHLDSSRRHLYRFATAEADDAVAAGHVRGRTLSSRLESVRLSPLMPKIATDDAAAAVGGAPLSPGVLFDGHGPFAQRDLIQDRTGSVRSTESTNGEDGSNQNDTLQHDAEPKNAVAQNSSSGINALTLDSAMDETASNEPRQLKVHKHGELINAPRMRQSLESTGNSALTESTDEELEVIAQSAGALPVVSIAAQQPDYADVPPLPSLGTTRNALAGHGVIQSAQFPAVVEQGDAVHDNVDPTLESSSHANAAGKKRILEEDYTATFAGMSLALLQDVPSVNWCNIEYEDEEKKTDDTRIGIPATPLLQQKQEIAGSNVNACIRVLDAGTFEEDVVQAYRNSAAKESEDAPPKRNLSIEEECPKLQSAMQAIQAFDWCQDMSSPIVPWKQTDTVTMLNSGPTSVASPAVARSKEMTVVSSQDRASFGHRRAEPVSSQLTTIDEMTPNECDELRLSYDWRDELLSPELSHELISATAHDSCSGEGPKEVATSATVMGDDETSEVSAVTTEEYGPKDSVDSEQSTEHCIVTPKTEAAEVAFGSTNTFDWKKELESPGISKRRIRASARDKLTGKAIGGLPIVDSALKTPEVQVTPIFFGSTDTFDWKKEMQSPALYHRSKRRTDSILVLHEGVSESRVSISRNQDDSLQQADPRMEALRGAEFRQVGGEAADLSELRRELALTGESAITSEADTPEDGFDMGAEQSNFHAIVDYQAMAKTGDSAPIVNQSYDIEGFDSGICVDVGVVRGSRGTVLATIRENTTASTGIDIEEHRRLLIEHQRLLDRLQSMSKNYDDRMTPFRDLFDEVSCSALVNALERLLSSIDQSCSVCLPRFGSDENCEWKSIA
jgi:hypothetical protein